MSYFVAPILTRLDRDAAKRLYDQGKTDAQIAQICFVSERTVGDWRREIGLTANRITVGEYFCDVKRCEKCRYWYGANGPTTNSIRFCNYLLVMGRRREQEGDKCLSFERRGKHEQAIRIPVEEGTGEGRITE